MCSAYAQLLVEGPLPTATVVPEATSSPSPSPTPKASPDPSPLPTTTPTPSDGSTTTVTDGSGYRQVRTPVVTLSLGNTAKTSSAAKGSSKSIATDGITNEPPATYQPQQNSGIFDEISLGYLDGTTTAPTANVSLQFDAGRAGANVWVQPLDGGKITVLNANGALVTSSDGVSIPLSALGQLSFGFQPPAKIGRYQVLIRLDNVSSTLPFVILDPAQID